MTVSVIQDREINYPDGEEFYSPSEPYPEYRFAHIASKPNPVYRAVRNCLSQAGLDGSHFGTPEWNPLRQLFPRGTRVFVLTNFVSHKRSNESMEDFYAKCTHGSVLRAVLDFVLLAVGNQGAVKFGNAPIQSCDWERVLQETGAARVLAFYRSHGAHVVEARDLRSVIVDNALFGGIRVVENKGMQDAVMIDLGRDSLLEELYRGNRPPKFRSLDYDPRSTDFFHGPEKHIYLISKELLQADAIVSIPKLKTHEKVGATLGVKSFVGGVVHKHCLAHFRLGSPRRGGDEYQSGQALNWLESRLNELTYSGAFTPYRKWVRTAIVLLRKFIHYGIRRNVGGGWKGNDTTWRMSVDIARIMQHADKDGVMHDRAARRLIAIVDGVISGEGHGPLKPRARHFGYLSYSDDIVSGDYVAACFMGMKPEAYPVIQRAFDLPRYSLTEKQPTDIDAMVNGSILNHGNLVSQRRSPFSMPPGWG